MTGQDNLTSPNQYQRDRSGMAIASLLLGFLSLITSFGFSLFVILPITIVGFILGVLSRHSKKKAAAHAGITLNSLVFLFWLIAAVYAMVWFFSGM